MQEHGHFNVFIIVISIFYVGTATGTISIYRIERYGIARTRDTNNAVASNVLRLLFPLFFLSLFLLPCFIY